jgi:hypothetical protein
MPSALVRISNPSPIRSRWRIPRSGRPSSKKPSPAVAHASSIRKTPPTLSVPALKAGHQVTANRLSNIDGEVRAHEQAHLAALGPFAKGSVEYSYIIGPDGQMYAVGGSIAVDLQPVPGDPEATIRKAQAIIRAAYAPTSPSGPDMHVAAEAYRMEMEAKAQLERETEAKRENGSDVYLYA